ncbi:DUF2207 domain-containing protein [soil metagenome]
MKRIFATLIFVLAILSPLTHTRAAENWKVTDFASTITVDPTGVVLVREEIAVDFGSETKHGIYRDIPVTYQAEDGTKTFTKVTLDAITQDGAAATFTQEVYNGYLQAKIGDADKTISGAHRYVITYRATGVLRSFATYDELYWNSTGNNWDVPIQHASATVTLPQDGVVQASCYVGAVLSTTNCTQVPGTRSVTFNHPSALQPGEGMTVAVGYTLGMVPILSVTEEQGSTTTLPTYFPLVLLSFFAVTLAAGCTFIWNRWSRRGRDGGKIQSAVAPEYDPPLNLRPGEIGVLLDETADTLDISATIVDLAVRGFLTITEVPKKGWFGKVDYKLTSLMKNQAELLGYEQRLMNSLFLARTECLTSDLTNTFYKQLAEVKEELYKEVTAKGLFVANPEKVRSGWVIWMIVCAVVGVFTTIMGLAVGDTVGSMCIGLGGALLITGVIGLIFTRAMPARTEAGRAAFEKARGYKMFLSATEKYRQPFFESENFFMDVLPYAMVFGVTAKLATSFATMGIVPSAAGWYIGTTPFSALSFGENMSSFSKSLGGAMASAPSSSGSGGGGFSGGGFGGGGGGSW